VIARNKCAHHLSTFLPCSEPSPTSLTQGFQGAARQPEDCTVWLSLTCLPCWGLWTPAGLVCPSSAPHNAVLFVIANRSAAPGFCAHWRNDSKCWSEKGDQATSSPRDGQPAGSSLQLGVEAAGSSKKSSFYLSHHALPVLTTQVTAKGVLPVLNGSICGKLWGRRRELSRFWVKQLGWLTEYWGLR
jgi:hypothetical protein